MKVLKAQLAELRQQAGIGTSAVSSAAVLAPNAEPAAALTEPVEAAAESAPAPPDSDAVPGEPVIAAGEATPAEPETQLPSSLDLPEQEVEMTEQGIVYPPALSHITHAAPAPSGMPPVATPEAATATLTATPGVTLAPHSSSSTMSAFRVSGSGVFRLLTSALTSSSTPATTSATGSLAAATSALANQPSSEPCASPAAIIAGAWTAIESPAPSLTISEIMGEEMSPLATLLPANTVFPCTAGAPAGFGSPMAAAVAAQPTAATAFGSPVAADLPAINGAAATSGTPAATADEGGGSTRFHVRSRATLPAEQSMRLRSLAPAGPEASAAPPSRPAVGASLVCTLFSGV